MFGFGRSLPDSECLARVEHRRRGWRGRTWAAMLRPVVRIDFLRPLIGRRCGGCGRLYGGDHGWRNADVAAAEKCPLEQGTYHRAKASAQTEGRLGDPGPATARAPSARPRSFQFNLAIDSKLRGC